mmetsp:Transcript_107303/g.280237  ORF Transcript_107303/g.280237 Transcript_107303/m.280237 type:complete len:508 (+) Transcript_107303:239-1762(+)
MLCDGALAGVVEHERGWQVHLQLRVELVPEGDAGQAVHARLHEGRVEVHFLVRCQGRQGDLVHDPLHVREVQALDLLHGLLCLRLLATFFGLWLFLLDLLLRGGSGARLTGKMLYAAEHLVGAVLHADVLALLREPDGLLGHVHAPVEVAGGKVDLRHEHDGVGLRPLGLDRAEELHGLVGTLQGLLVLAQRHLHLGHRVDGAAQQEPVVELLRLGQRLLRGLERLRPRPLDGAVLVLAGEDLRPSARHCHLGGEDVSLDELLLVLRLLRQRHGLRRRHDGLRGLLHLQVRLRHRLQRQGLGAPVAQLGEELLRLLRGLERLLGLPLSEALAAREADLRDDQQGDGLAGLVVRLLEQALRLGGGRHGHVHVLLGDGERLCPHHRDLKHDDALAHLVLHPLAELPLLAARPHGRVELVAHLLHGRHRVQHQHHLAVVAHVAQQRTRLLSDVRSLGLVPGPDAELEDRVQDLGLPHLVPQVAGDRQARVGHLERLVHVTVVVHVAPDVG